jgi:hypothetical protein
MKLYELSVTIEVEDGLSDDEVEAMCDDLDTACPEEVVYDTLVSVLDNTSLGKALTARKATLKVSE